MFLILTNSAIKKYSKNSNIVKYYILKYLYFNNCFIFYNITVFTVFFYFRVCENKKLLSETFKKCSA